MTIDCNGVTYTTCHQSHTEPPQGLIRSQGCHNLKKLGESTQVLCDDPKASMDLSRIRAEVKLIISQASKNISQVTKKRAE